MNRAIRATLFAGAALTFSIGGQAALADKIEANCTGMLDFDIYVFDTAEPVQDVAKIGTAEVEISEESILLTGDFGSYEFDRKAGTLYHNGSDTGVYCTYSRKAD